jgi:phosphonatase-like hydrolase
MKEIKLVVLDMAGTTVMDQHEVEYCFKQAAIKNELHSSDERILALQGYAKLYVFTLLWTEQLGVGDPRITEQAAQSYADFKTILENHYRTQPVYPTEGCLALFEALHQKGIKIALTTGFYREVADIILGRLGWVANLESSTSIHLSVTPDEVNGEGRPSPAMIKYAMKSLGITDLEEVINVGDTPVDLLFGKNAGVRYALGVCNGTHSREQLAAHSNDGLLEKISDLLAYV